MNLRAHGRRGPFGRLSPEHGGRELQAADDQHGADQQPAESGFHSGMEGGGIGGVHGVRIWRSLRGSSLNLCRSRPVCQAYSRDR